MTCRQRQAGRFPKNTKSQWHKTLRSRGNAKTAKYLSRALYKAYPYYLVPRKKNPETGVLRPTDSLRVTHW